MVRVLELCQIWQPSTEIVPQLWAVVRESYKSHDHSPLSGSNGSQNGDITTEWPIFIATFDRTTSLASLKLSPPARWSKDKDFDLFLRILFVLMYKTALPFTIPPSPLLSLPINYSPLRLQSSPSRSPAPRTSLPGDLSLLPIASPCKSVTETLSSFSYSSFPSIPLGSLYLPETLAKKFSSAIYQSSWVKKLLPPRHLFCLEMLLNIHKDKKAYLNHLKPIVEGKHEVKQVE